MVSLLSNLKLLRAALAIALLSLCTQAAFAEGENRVLAAYNRASHSATPQKIQNDPGVSAAKFQSPVSENPRLLAPPTRQQIAKPTGSDATKSSPRAHAVAMPKIESLTTAAAGLAIVVGLFLACAWLLRRSGPKPTSPLPSEAVAVLGRVPLAARNFAHLLQVGNKLVLVAITPDGVSPITEITDPAEVQRMLGLCRRNHKHSTTAEFQDVLAKLSEEPTSGFLGNEVLGNQATASYTSQGRA
ncbi:MAG: FliO/MopB family protein [Planctomycetes bacterium]|nr:FliO/MopB family protein [Planctomycetota bacterium]